MSPTMSTWINCPFPFILTYPFCLKAFTIHFPSQAAIMPTLTGRVVRNSHGGQGDLMAAGRFGSMWTVSSRSCEIIQSTKGLRGGDLNAQGISWNGCAENCSNPSGKWMKFMKLWPSQVNADDSLNSKATLLGLDKPPSTLLNCSSLY